MPLLSSSENAMTQALAAVHSPLAARHSPLDALADWLSVADVAQRLSLSERRVQQLCHRWAQDGRARFSVPPEGGKPAWLVHASVDDRLRSGAPSSPPNDDDLLARYPLHLLDRARRKARWMHEWRKRLAEPQMELAPAPRTDAEIAAAVVAEAKAAEGADFRVSVRSLQSWWSAYNAIGHQGRLRGLEGLIDHYAVGEFGAFAGRTGDAVKLFYDLYHARRQFSIRQCHDQVLAQARVRGWCWPESVRATANWLARHDDLAMTYLCREGPDAYNRKYMPFAEMDWDLVEPGRFFVSDHHQCDFWVRYKNDLIRPWLTAVQDCRSRRIVGWRLGPAPHQESIICALRMAFREAVPEALRVDNGKDFTAKAFTGFTKGEYRDLRRAHGRDWRSMARRGSALRICDDPRWTGIADQLGIRLIFANPYSPWSKGTLERFFGTFEDQCGKSIITFCGNNPRKRPETIDALRGQAPILEDARSSIGDWIKLYEAAPHSGAGVDGKTPRAVWSQAASVRRAEETALDFLLSIRGAYRVGANGVRVRIGGKALGYGAACSALVRWRGRKVLIAVDPEHPARSLAFDPRNRKFIAPLEQNERLHPCATTDDVREGIAEVRRRRKAARHVTADSLVRERGAAALINADRQRRLNELRATGTDDARPNLAALVTGFEDAAKRVPSVSEARSSIPPVDLRRLADAAEVPSLRKSDSFWRRLQDAAGRRADDA